MVKDANGVADDQLVDCTKRKKSVECALRV